MPCLNTNLLPFENLDPLDSIVPTTNLDRAAAVLIAISDDKQPKILYTRRADHLNSHSGHVSFPGGRWEVGDDVGDKGLSDTALRESSEEVSLLPRQVCLKGCMAPKVSSNRLDVFPYVGVIPSSVKLVASPDEIADIFYVPVEFFVKQPPSSIDLLKRDGVIVRVPAWNYEGYDIWGLTAMFTYDLLSRFNVEIDLCSAPERHFD